MKMVFNRSRIFMVGALMILSILCVTPLVFAASISIENKTVKPNDSVTIDFIFDTEGDTLSAINCDLIYPSSDLQLDSIDLGVSASEALKLLATHSSADGIEKIVIYGLNDTAISSGVLLQACFTVKNDANEGAKNLSLTNVVGASPGATAVSVSAESGSIVVDTTAPVLTVTTPEEGAVLATDVVTVAGTVDDVAIAAVYINETSVAVSSGAFSYEITLPEGDQTIEVVATDGAGNSSSDARIVTIDLTAPIVEILEPVDGDTLGTGTVIVSGTVDDVTIETVSINGTTVGVTDGTFSDSITVPEGTQTITVSATDAAGNEGVSSLDVVIDSVAPVVTITSPADGDCFGSRLVLISGLVDDIEIMQVDIDGETVDVIDGSFSTTMTLDEGHNVITVTAIDAAGNEGVHTIEVSILLGDVNEDGIIDTSDIGIIRQQILAEVGQSLTADVNSDGTVNVLDLQSVINKL